eukprot:2003588-Amphidinium_carterae.1
MGNCFDWNIWWCIVNGLNPNVEHGSVLMFQMAQKCNAYADLGEDGLMAAATRSNHVCSTNGLRSTGDVSVPLKHRDGPACLWFSTAGRLAHHEPPCPTMWGDLQSKVLLNAQWLVCLHVMSYRLYKSHARKKRSPRAPTLGGLRPAGQSSSPSKCADGRARWPFF